MSQKSRRKHVCKKHQCNPWWATAAPLPWLQLEGVERIDLVGRPDCGESVDLHEVVGMHLRQAQLPARATAVRGEWWGKARVSQKAQAPQLRVQVQGFTRTKPQLQCSVTRHRFANKPTSPT